MKKFKRVLITLLLIMLCACFSGCGKSESESALETATAAKDGVDWLSSHKVGPWYKAIFSEEIVTQSTYDRKKAETSNNIKQSVKNIVSLKGKAVSKDNAKSKDESKGSEAKKAIIVVIVFLIIVSIPFAFKFIFLPYIVGKNVAKGAAKAINKQGGIAVNPAPPSPRSGRLAVDYPKLLQQDCAVLGLDYNSVLADFNGNAEKAYETIHVQVLKQQYN